MRTHWPQAGQHTSTWLAPAPHGYWLVGSDGGIFTFGSALFYGSTGSLKLQRPVVGIVPTADRGGYWLDASDGGVFSYGDTQFHGSSQASACTRQAQVCPTASTPPSWAWCLRATEAATSWWPPMAASLHSETPASGSCPGIAGCSGAAVAVMPDHSGNGYWVVTATGHVYTFGDAPYFGGPGRGTVTSAVATPDGMGYWVLLSDGEVLSYGDAAPLGSPRSAISTPSTLPLPSSRPPTERATGFRRRSVRSSTTVTRPTTAACRERTSMEPSRGHRVLMWLTE